MPAPVIARALAKLPHVAFVNAYGLTETSSTIALLGGGPVGLATAMLLARAGFDATVFDARPLDGARADRRLLALSRGSLQLLRPLLASQAPPMAPIVDVHVSSAGEFGSSSSSFTGGSSSICCSSASAAFPSLRPSR